MTSMAVHREGVVAFASLPGGSYAYMIDYENVDGRVWLKSNATEREWECEIANSDVFAANPAFREQFDMELELLQLALQQDPRVRKTVTCKHVVLTKADIGDDLVMQLNQKVYARLNPNMGAMVQFQLKYVAGTGTTPLHNHTTALQDTPEPVKKTTPPPPRAAKAVKKATQTEKQQKLLPRLREENKALKATNKALSTDLKRARAEINALRKENQAVSAAKVAYATDITLLEREHVESLRQWKTENDALRRENRQFQQQHAALIKMGGMHEFQRQHIEHLRRKIQALEGQTVGGQQEEVQSENVQEQVVISSKSSDKKGGEDQEQEIQQPAVTAAAAAAADHPNKRCRLSDK